MILEAMKMENEILARPIVPWKAIMYQVMNLSNRINHS